MDDETCTCGHVYDEHDRGVECEVEGCDCWQFEADDE